MDAFIDNVRVVLQQVFSIEIGELSIGGGAVFMLLLIVLLIGKAFVANIQEFLKIYLKNKTNFTIIGIYIGGIFLFFFLNLPFSLVIWIIAGAGMIIGRLIFGNHLSLRVGGLICITIGLISPFLELVYDHHSNRRNQHFEVYFLLPREKNISTSAELGEIRKSMYNVFSKVFDLKGFNVLESIIIYPKSYLEYDTEFQINATAEPSLVKKVLDYGRAEKTPVDIVIRGDFRYYKEKSLIVLVINYQKPDSNNQRLVNLHSSGRFLGKSDDLEWLSILACNQFVGFIRDRKIKIGDNEFTIANHEKHLLKNILREYRDFLLTQSEVNTTLLSEVNEMLVSDSKMSYEQTSRLLANYASSDLSVTLDDQAEGARAAVMKKLGISE